MTVPSNPIRIGDKSYHLRFNRADVKAMENALGVGYRYFVKPGIWGSFTADEAFIWRGLKEEDKAGGYVHVFDQNDSGKDDAGNFIEKFMKDGGDLSEIEVLILEAFFDQGLFKRKDSDSAESGDGDEKNPKPTGTP